MEITEVRIKLMEETGDRLRAFCSITFDDCFVIRDLKIIEGASGPFVAMPSRKLTARCPQCGSKNHLRAGYCNHCGLRMKDETPLKDQEGRAKLYADIAHPINSACREMIQQRVVIEYKTEMERAKQPGYRSRYDDFFGDEEIEAEPAEETTRETSPPSAAKPAEPPAVTFERPHVEPGTVEPRAPHTPLRKQTRPSPRRTQQGGFGRGIFDD